MKDDLIGNATRRTLALEGEVLREVSALVVATEQEDFDGVPQLERIQVQQTLLALMSVCTGMGQDGMYLYSKAASIDVVSKE